MTKLPSFNIVSSLARKIINLTVHRLLRTLLIELVEFAKSDMHRIMIGRAWTKVDESDIQSDQNDCNRDPSHLVLEQIDLLGLKNTPSYTRLIPPPSHLPWALAFSYNRLITLAIHRKIDGPWLFQLKE